MIDPTKLAPYADYVLSDAVLAELPGYYGGNPYYYDPGY